MWDWLELAAHLHLPLQLVQEYTTPSEFVLWMVYLSLKQQEEFQTIQKQDYYNAQIAAEIRRGYVKNPEKVKIEDFILKFEFKEEKKEIDWKQKMQQSKRYWMSTSGFKKKDKDGRT